jgi:hypothetical protein
MTMALGSAKPIRNHGPSSKALHAAATARVRVGLAVRAYLLPRGPQPWVDPVERRPAFGTGLFAVDHVAESRCRSWPSSTEQKVLFSSPSARLKISY